MTVDAAEIGGDRARLLGAATLSEDETRLQIGEVEVTEFLDRERLAIEQPFFGGVVALRDPAQLRLGFLARAFRCPHSVQPDREPARSASRPILKDVASLSGRENPEAKARELVVPDHIILGAGFCCVDYPLGELSHGVSPTLPPRLA